VGVALRLRTRGFLPPPTPLFPPLLPSPAQRGRADLNTSRISRAVASKGTLRTTSLVLLLPARGKKEVQRYTSWPILNAQ